MVDAVWCCGRGDLPGKEFVLMNLRRAHVGPCEDLRHGM